MPRALTLKPVHGAKPGQVYYPLQLKQVPKPSPGPHELLIRLHAAALNRRDLFIRQRLYPVISLDSPMLADGCGSVVAVGPQVARRDLLLHRPVLLTPMRGWESDPAGPEDPSRFAVTGSSRLTPVGAAQDYVVVHEDQVEPAPDHLSPAEGAALPIAGLTAWRSLVTKAADADAAVLRGRNILITGIGGGVALLVLQFAVALGANVFVTSGDAAKIDRAVAMGARAGVSYRGDAWHKDLAALLPRERPRLDAVIDGSGGAIVARAVALLKPGGVIVQYGMTASPRMDWIMQAVLANVELKGTTLGSRREFADMIAFVRENKIRPVVDKTVRGLHDLEAIDALFSHMKEGRQFGKLVIEIGDEALSTKL